MCIRDSYIVEGPAAENSGCRVSQEVIARLSTFFSDLNFEDIEYKSLNIIQDPIPFDHEYQVLSSFFNQSQERGDWRINIQYSR